MINFLISIAVLAATFFMMVFSIRYGERGVLRLDQHLSNKRNSIYEGFQWYFRIPFVIGVIPEYFYAMILTHEYYFKKNWWSLRIASYISVLLFIALLKSRSAVLDYLSFQFVIENGILALFTSGNFVIFMNIIVISYLILFTLICIESFKMHGLYAPIRILAYSLLCFLMANFTIITLSIIAFIAVAYLIIKIIGFLFFSSKKNKKEEEEEESAGSILNGGFQIFKSDLYEWEADNKAYRSNDKEKESVITERKKPKITRRKRKKAQPKNDDIPRLHPD